jgi:cytochrome c-type biogenesis protein CcmH
MRPLPLGLLTIALVVLPIAGLEAQQAAPLGGQTLGLDAPKVLDAPAGKPLSGDELELRTQEVASLMRCPVCQGLSIADSPVDSAVAMKGEVRDLLALGYSEEQILTYFENSYGEFIRLAPKPKGFNLVVWITPVLAILAGLALVVLRLRRGPEPVVATEGDPAPDAELDGYLDRVRQEAKR